MATGYQTLREIERAIADLRRREQEQQRLLGTANDERAKLVSQRTAAFRELAEVRTQTALADGVIDDADQLQARVANLLSARQQTIRALQSRSERINAQRAAKVDAADRLASAIDEREAELDEIADMARAQLLNEPEYQALVAAQETAEETLANAEEKTSRAERDRVTKGAAYENDPLFMYLWHRKHGQKDKSPWFFIAWLDDWVARKVGYHEARANYALLQEIPKRLRAHTDQLSHGVAQAKAAVMAAEAKRIQQLAGTDLQSAIAQSHAQRAEVVAAIEATDAEIADVTEQLNRYSEGRDEGFQEALAVSAQFLEQTRLDDLRLQARQTPTPSDDDIVARIETLNERRNEVELKINGARDQLETISQRRQELLEVAAKFRRNHYDRPNSVFEPDDIASVLLEELIRGALTGAEYWSRSRRRHTWGARSADPFRRSKRTPPFGGRRSGGGFRTGGGF